jgi:hypothetical protein
VRADRVKDAAQAASLVCGLHGLDQGVVGVVLAEPLICGRGTDFVSDQRFASPPNTGPPRIMLSLCWA